MAGQYIAPSKRFQEQLNSFRKEIEQACQSLFLKLQHEANGYAFELDQRSKELDAKAERLEQRENACCKFEKQTRASSRQKVDTRNVGIQAR